MNIVTSNYISLTNFKMSIVGSLVALSINRIVRAEIGVFNLHNKAIVNKPARFHPWIRLLFNHCLSNNILKENRDLGISLSTMRKGLYGRKQEVAS